MTKRRLTKRQWARTRQAMYVVGSGTLKYLGIKGIVDDNEGQILVLILSGLLDLAFVKVDLPDATQPEGTEETQYE